MAYRTPCGQPAHGMAMTRDARAPPGEAPQGRGRTAVAGRGAGDGAQEIWKISRRSLPSTRRIERQLELSLRVIQRRSSLR